MTIESSLPILDRTVSFVLCDLIDNISIIIAVITENKGSSLILASEPYIDLYIRISITEKTTEASIHKINKFPLGL